MPTYINSLCKLILKKILEQNNISKTGIYTEFEALLKSFFFINKLINLLSL